MEEEDGSLLLPCAAAAAAAVVVVVWLLLLSPIFFTLSLNMLASRSVYPFFLFLPPPFPCMWYAYNLFVPDALLEVRERDFSWRCSKVFPLFPPLHSR